MKFAISNISLPQYNHESELFSLGDLGIKGIEVAPSRIWCETWRHLKSTDIESYRTAVERANLRVIGLHSLLYDQPHLGLFEHSTRQLTLEFLTHLSAVCRDLGGTTLIWGGKRLRGSLSPHDACLYTIDFFNELCNRVSNHGTCFCLEPLTFQDSDFINSARESLNIVTAVDHPAFKVQLDAKALVACNESDIGLFREVAPHLIHFHANEPDLGILGSSQTINHGLLGHHLRVIGYSGYISIEQRMLNKDNPLEDVSKSIEVLKEFYQ